MESREEDIPSGMPEETEAEGFEAQPLGVPAEADPSADEPSLPGIPDEGEAPTSG